MDELGSQRLSLRRPDEDQNAHHLVPNPGTMCPNVLTGVDKVLELFGVSHHSEAMAQLSEVVRS